MNNKNKIFISKFPSGLISKIAKIFRNSLQGQPFMIFKTFKIKLMNNSYFGENR